MRQLKKNTVATFDNSTEAVDILTAVSRNTFLISGNFDALRDSLPLYDYLRDSAEFRLPTDRRFKTVNGIPIK